jgi:hypothetical protein
MPLQLTLWLLGAVAVGVVLLLVGWRGKRINDHPVCRQCRFDLLGTPEGTITCPECGAGLKRPGSTRIGQRRKRPLCLGVGALAVLLPALAIGTAGFAMLTGQDAHRWLPLGALLWESRHADATRQQQIGAEVLKRYTAKALSPDQVDAAVDAALEIQGNASRPWAVEWGDLIEAVKSDGKLSDARQHRYQNQAAVLEWKARPTISEDDPLPIVVKLKEARIGAAAALQASVTLSSATVDGKLASRASQSQWAGLPMFMNPNLGWFQMFGKNNRFGWSAPFGEAKLLLDPSEKLTPGRHVAKVKIAIQTNPQTFGTVAWPNPNKTDVNVRWDEHEVAFDVAAGRAGVELVEPSAGDKKKMEQLLEASNLQVYKYGPGQPPVAQAQFNVDGKPMDGAFDVILRSGEREWPLGSFTTGTSASGDPGFGPGMETQRLASGPVPGFKAGKVDLVLRPSPKAAAATLDVVRMYNAEIVYKDLEVPMQDMSSAMRGTVSTTVTSSAGDENGDGEKEAPDKSGKGDDPSPESKSKPQGPGLFGSISRLLYGKH